MVGYQLVSIDGNRRQYKVRLSSGETIEVAYDEIDREARAAMAWLESLDHSRPAPVELAIGRRHFDWAAQTFEAANIMYTMTGKRCLASLTPRLIGLEGQFIEVTEIDDVGQKFVERYRVGQSQGWLPCHVKLKPSDVGLPLDHTAPARISDDATIEVLLIREGRPGRRPIVVRKTRCASTSMYQRVGPEYQARRMDVDRMAPIPEETSEEEMLEIASDLEALGLAPRIVAEFPYARRVGWETMSRRGRRASLHAHQTRKKAAYP